MSKKRKLTAPEAIIEDNEFDDSELIIEPKSFVESENQEDKDYDPAATLDKMIKEDKGMLTPEMVEEAMTGPESFEELDAEKEARERAWKAHSITYEAESLIHNVIRNPFIKPDEKAKKIAVIGDGEEMATRIEDTLTEKEMNEDLDILRIEGILKHSEPSWMERVTSLFQKEKLSSEARSSLKDSDFALVVTRDGKKIRKYPIHDKAHVRNALARAAQMIKRGGEAAKDARAALAKIRTAAKKFGIEVSMNKEFPNSIVIEKDESGSWRWIGWVSNNYKDREGDILTEEAHKDYVKWLDENPQLAPVLLLWHVPGTAMEKAADFWMYENSFLVMSGELTDREAGGLLKAATHSPLGMSHGFFATAREEGNRKNIVQYRTYEVSVLPLHKAANIWTSFDAIIKEVRNMDKKLEFLSNVLGEERAKDFLEKTGLMKEALDEANIESKENENPEPEGEKKPQTDQSNDQATQTTDKKEVEDEIPEADPIAKMAADLGLDQLSDWVGETQQFNKMVADGLTALGARLEKLEESHTKGLAEAFEPPANKQFKWQRPSEDDQKALDADSEDDQELKKSKPGLTGSEVGWLSQVTKTAPVSE